MADSAVPFSPELGLQHFRSLARIVRADAGIVLEDHKRTMVQGRLARRLRALRLADYAAYVDRVETDPSERAAMIEEITTNHTNFFREAHHFEHLRAVCLPELLARAFAGGRLRIWSAGCASGEEPYSIALSLLDAARAFGEGWLDRADMAILATDLSTGALEIAGRGDYPRGALAPVPPQLLDGRIETAPQDRIRFTADVRALISFRQLNLLGDWPMRGRFDVIFCRNVFIYFDEPTKARLYERFADALTPAGWLYIGHSERVSGPAAGRLRPMGQTIYRNLGETGT